jgi:hypothetical protein
VTGDHPDTELGGFVQEPCVLMPGPLDVDHRAADLMDLFDAAESQIAGVPGGTPFLTEFFACKVIKIVCRKITTH